MKTTKTILFLFLIGFWMMGCHSHDHGAEHGNATHQHTTSELNLQLDNAKKWIANPETQEGFKEIQGQLGAFTKQEAPQLSDYNRLGKELQTKVDEIVNRCTMTGQGHEELHKLLIPVIQNIKTLKEDDETACKKAVEQLSHLTDIYFDYFRVEE